jgi:hypothetical protein
LEWVWDNFTLPTTEELSTLDQLSAAMRPVEILTKNLCQAGFDTLMAESVFQSALQALQAQNTCVADQLYRSLAVRYQDRQNIKLISALKFRTDPIGYRPNRGSL